MAIPQDYKYIPYKTSVPVILYENKENENYPLHWHTATEIIMPLEGEYEITLRDKDYRLRENDIFIVPARALHKITVPPLAENGRRIIIQFEAAQFLSLPGLSGIFPSLNHINLITPESTPEIFEHIRALLLDSLKEHSTRDSLRSIAIYAKMMELYVILARYYNSKKIFRHDNTPHSRQEYITRLCTVLEYIDQHIDDNLTLDLASRIANFSKFHFERMFKSYTNQSFHRYIKQRRIDKAETLLVNPELTITQAAAGAGFSSLTTFNRVFKEIKNCTPSEFKKLHLSAKV